MTHTHTHTKVIINSSTLETVRQLSKRNTPGYRLEKVKGPDGELEGFRLDDSSHYEVRNADGATDHRAPMWVIFDQQGEPFVVTIEAFEASWSVVKGRWD